MLPGVCGESVRSLTAAAPQEFGRRQARVPEIELLDAASYRSASRTTFRTAEGPFAKLALWKNGRGDALQAPKVGRLCAENPFCCRRACAREYCSIEKCSQNVPERGDPWEKTRSTRLLQKPARHKLRSLQQCIGTTAEDLCASHCCHHNRWRELRCL